MTKYYKYYPPKPLYGPEMAELMLELNSRDIMMAGKSAIRAWMDFSDQVCNQDFVEVYDLSVDDFVKWLDEQAEKKNAVVVTMIQEG